MYASIKEYLLCRKPFMALFYDMWMNQLGVWESAQAIGLSTHPGTGVDGASGRGWKLADFLLKHV